MKNNRPFKLRPSGKDYLWGGQRFNNEYGKNIDIDPLAETWECSTHPDGPSYIVGGDFDGRELAEVIKAYPALLGCKHEGMTELPILVKLIDANKALSVQVHPTDEYAFVHENGQQGKTEMWYILDASADACIVYGLRTECTEAELRAAIEAETLSKYLNKVRVRKGEVYFIPAGTIHAIGAGCLIAEIQENSNLTYRMYDYGRIGKDGKKRELHIDKALAVAKLDGEAEPRQPIRVLNYRQGVAVEQLARCKYFEVYRMLLNNIDKSVDYCTDELSYRVLMCVDGTVELEMNSDNMHIAKGDCVFVPANSVEIKLKGNAELLDIRG